MFQPRERIMELHTDIHRHIQTYTDTYRHTRTHTDIHGHIQTYTDKKISTISGALQEKLNEFIKFMRKTYKNGIT